MKPLSAAGFLAVFDQAAASMRDFHVSRLRHRDTSQPKWSGRIVVFGYVPANELIGQSVGVDHTGGYYSNCIGPLSTAGLITRRAGVVAPTEVLFPAGLR